MSLLRLFFGFIVFFGWRTVRSSIGDKRAVITFIFLASLFLNAFLPDQKLIDTFVSLLKISAFALIFAEIIVWKSIGGGNADDSPQEQRRRGIRVILFSGGLMALVGVHNLLNISFLLDSSNQGTVTALNPWGLFFTAFVLFGAFFFSIKQHDNGDIVDSSLFRKCIFVSAIVACGILVLVYRQYLPGNAAKLADGTGGVGLGSISTNETALLGCCLLMWILKIQHSRGVSFPTLAGSGCAICIVFLTQSRLGLASLFIILMLYFIGTIKFRAKQILLAVIIIAALSGPALYVINQRMTADTGFISKVEGADMVGSGRAFIWLSYLDAFGDVAQERPLAWILGVGPAGVVNLYDNTVLRTFSVDVAQGTFFPLHSDLVFTFLAIGSLGLFIWIGLVHTIYCQIRKNRFNFCAMSALLIFILYSVFDMLIYFPLGVWLLAQAMLSLTDKHGDELPNLS